MKKNIFRYKGTTEERRKNRTRKQIRSLTRPRLSVFRSGRYIYAQIIDDSKAITLAAASSLEKEASSLGKSRANCKAAQWVGNAIASRAKEKGITEIVFDRGAYLYHGRVKNLAESAREGGLNF